MVAIIVLRFPNRTGGFRTGRPVPEQDKVLDRDITYIRAL